jgi:antibiotic biosynthesis monooxygenase (ABM) superfamily enzyme
VSDARPAIFVVKATIAPEQEAAFNAWYDGVRSGEAARVPGCINMRRYAALPLESPHAGAEPWQYMVCYEFDSEAALQAFVRSETLKEMTRDYDARFGGAGERARFAYRQIYP